MKAKDEKTNVMRVLDSKKIKYQHYYYGDTDAISGTEVAKALGQNPDCVFKTLVTEGKTKNHYVFIVPVEKELDLKKAVQDLQQLLHRQLTYMKKHLKKLRRMGQQLIWIAQISTYGNIQTVTYSHL